MNLQVAKPYGNTLTVAVAPADRLAAEDFLRDLPESMPAAMSCGGKRKAITPASSDRAQRLTTPASGSRQHQLNSSERVSASAQQSSNSQAVDDNE